MTDKIELQRQIPLSLIKAGANPRRYFNPEKHAELVASLRRNGMLQPILVRPVNDNTAYELVAGGRRYRAAAEAQADA